MKRLFVFTPAVVLVLFLLNSFLTKDNEGKENRIKEGKSAANASIIFKSIDGGQTWQDISKGLPEKLRREGVWGDGLMASDHGLYLRAGNGVYRNEPNSTDPVWTKDTFPGRQRNLTHGRNGIYAYDFRGQFLQKVNGASNWSPIYTNFQEQALCIDTTKDWMTKTYHEKIVHNVFETGSGAILISSNTVLFRSTDSGKTWKKAYVGGGAMKFVESNGVLLANFKGGILRSTDDGQSWERVVSEKGVGLVVERIEGGFAAILHNTTTETNSVQLSMDGGKTWNVTGEDLQPSWGSLLMKKVGLVKSSPNILSIKQMGNYLVCGRSDGLFRSADKGKTWQQLSLPDIGKFGFNLSVSGKAMYVIPYKGC